MSNANILTDYRLDRDYAMFERAVALCRGRELAIDVGAHKGMWTAWMAAHFEPDEGFDIEDYRDRHEDEVEF